MSSGNQNAARAGARQQHEKSQDDGLLLRVVQSTLESHEFRERVDKVLPKEHGLDADRFASIALLAAVKQPELLRCDPLSLERAVLQAAQIGLEIGGPLKHAALVPWWDRDQRKFIAELMPMYQGLIFLATKSGSITKAVVRGVYKGDLFHVRYGSDEGIEHVPAWKHDADEDIEQFYSIVWLPDGQQKFDVMTRPQVERIRQGAKSKNSPAWVNHYGEMGKKVVLKRNLKTVPIGDGLPALRLQEAIEIDNRWETGRKAVAIRGDTLDEVVRETEAARRTMVAVPATAEPEPEPAKPDPLEPLCRRALELAQVPQEKINRALLDFEGNLDALVADIEKNRPEALKRAREEARLAAEAAAMQRPPDADEGDGEATDDDSAANPAAQSTDPLDLFGE